MELDSKKVSIDTVIADNKPRIFISYSRDDRAFADLLVEALDNRGFSVLIDRSDVRQGEIFWQRIQDLIIQGNLVIFIISPPAVESSWCQKELAFARAQGKRIVPILFRTAQDMVRPPDLDGINAVDFGALGRAFGPTAEVADALRVAETRSAIDPHGFERVRLAHDDSAVAFRNEFETNAIFLRALDHLEQALQLDDLLWEDEKNDWLTRASDWQREDFPTTYLLTRGDVTRLESWESRRPSKGEIPDLLRRYLRESRRVQAARQQRIIAGAFAVAAVAIGLASFAYVQRNTAIEQRLTAESNEAALRSDMTRVENPRVALAFALEAYEKMADIVALNAVRRSIDQVGLLKVSDFGKSISTEGRGFGARWAVAADRGLIALAIGEDEIAVLDSESLERIRSHEGRRAGSMGLSMSATGSFLAEADGSETVLVWEANGANVARTLMANHTVENVKFGRTESIAAFIGKTEVSFYRLPDWHHLSTVENIWIVSPKALDFSGDDARAVLTGPDNWAWIVATETGSILTELDLRPEGAQREPFRNGSDMVLLGQAYFLNDTNRILTLGAHGPLRLWDAQTGLEVAAQEGFAGGVNWALIASNETHALINRSGTGEIEAWSLKDAIQGTVFDRRHENLIGSADISPDDQLAVTVGEDGKLIIWDLVERRHIGEWRAIFSNTLDVFFTKSGKKLVTVSGDGRLALWDADTVVRLGRIEIEGPAGFRYLADGRLSNDGKFLITRGVMSSTVFWDLQHWRRRFEASIDGSVDATMSNDNRWLAIVASHTQLDELEEKRKAPGKGKTSVHLWRDLKAKDVIWYDDDFFGAVFSPTQSYLALFGFSSRVVVIDPLDRRVVSIAELGDRFAKTVAFSQDGLLCVITTNDGIIVADTTSGQHRATIAAGLDIQKAAVGPFGKRAFTAHGDNLIRVWDIAAGQLVTTLRGHTGVPQGFRTLDDGRLLLTWSDDGSIILWNASDGSLLRRISTTDDGVLHAVTVDEDSMIISIGRDGIVWRHQCNACRDEANLLAAASKAVPDRSH